MTFEPIETQQRRSHWWAVQLLFVAAATLAITPLFFSDGLTGHDSSFHFLSWIEAAQQWREGTFYPRWAGAANYHLGEPRFIFYPPLSWMLGAALTSILPLNTVPGVFIWLALVVAGNSMWIFAREYLSPAEAAAAGLLHLASPYNFVNAYIRCDFSELLAGAMFPLLVWSVLRKVRDNRLSFAPIAVVLAVIWLTNAPAGVISSYSLWLLLLISCIVVGSWRPLQTASLSTLTGFGFAAFYIIPAAWEQKWVHIHWISPSPQFPDHSFLFAIGSNWDPKFLLRLSEVAMLMIGGSAIAAVLTRQLRREKPEVWWPTAGLGVVSIVLMFPISIIAWRILPELRMVQFPWRWLFPLGTVGAFLISSAIYQHRYRRILCLALGLTIAGLDGRMAVSAFGSYRGGTLAALAARFPKGYWGVPEYLPLNSSFFSVYLTAAPLPKEFPNIVVADQHTFGSHSDGDARIQVLQWSAEKKIFLVHSPDSLTATLGLLDYPAWEVTLNGSRIAASAKEKTGQIVFSIPSGVSRVQVRFARTRDRRLGMAVTFGSSLVLAFFGIVSSRRRIKDTGASGGITP
jgi:6-pyruvoyl-tetrahydropterin synthase related domain